MTRVHKTFTIQNKAKAKGVEIKLFLSTQLMRIRTRCRRMHWFFLLPLSLSSSAFFCHQSNEGMDQWGPSFGFGTSKVYNEMGRAIGKEDGNRKISKLIRWEEMEPTGQSFVMQRFNQLVYNTGRMIRRIIIYVRHVHFVLCFAFPLRFVKVKMFLFFSFFLNIFSLSLSLARHFKKQLPFHWPREEARDLRLAGPPVGPTVTAWWERKSPRRASLVL